MSEKGSTPKILVFSTENVSDPGIDLAGRNKMHYSPLVYVITLPCSSGIKPKWIIHALENGFDGVFLAADGNDCSYLEDCTARTGAVMARTQEMMVEREINPARVKMAALCSVCAEPFEKYMKNFNTALKKIGSAESGE
ncbi:MAG: hydrogenase iron-sulfur subunit [Bacteroidales bacterium]|nr:hydrogenase iron-sulfur subunit [Candidatus Latescibacterota bacterium]